MRLKTHVLELAAVVLLVLAPFCGLPTLSAHAPTLTAATLPAPGHSHLPGLSPFLVPLAGITIRKDTGSIAKKFSARAAQASGDYKEGVAAAGNDWQANTLAGETNFEQGVQAAIADKRFGKGVSAAGAAKYTQNATTLGPQRFSTGVANAEGAYMKGVQPHLDAMKSLQLPPRGPKGSAQNQQRAQIVAQRNRDVKLGK